MRDIERRVADADGRTIDAVVLPYPSGEPSNQIGVWLPIGQYKLLFLATPSRCRVSLDGTVGSHSDQVFTLDEMEQFAAGLLGGIRAMKARQPKPRLPEPVMWSTR